MTEYQLFKRNAPKSIYTRRKGNEKENKYLIFISFLLPILLLLPAFINLGIFPFGGSSTLAVDLRNQYMGFFEALKQAPADPASLLYSFSKGPGGMMPATDAYYLMSPLNLIFFIFPSDLLPIAVEIIQLLKLGLAGASFAFYLIKSQKARDAKILIFASAYALMGFNIANMMNLIWLDPIILLPIIAYYLEEMIKGKSPLPYTLWLTLAIISNFYMAYMVCIFLILFAGWTLIRLPKQKISGPKFYLRAFARFAIYSLLAGTLSAWLILPTVHSLFLSKGPYADRVVAGWKFSHPFFDSFVRLIPFAFDYSQVSNGMPNIYIGVFSSILSFIYFLNRRIGLKEKIGSLLIIVFLILSMNIEKLNIFWHGMQYPIWYNYRFSWLLCFFALVLAFRCIQRLDKISWIQWISTIFIFSCLSAYIFYRKATDKESMQYFHIVYLLAFPVLIFIFTELLNRVKKPDLISSGQVYKIVLLALCLIELSVNSAFYLSVFNYESLEEYSYYDNSVRPVIEKYRGDMKNFYRIEKTFYHDKNDGMRFGYSGLSHFNSTYEHQTIELLSDMGFARARASSYGCNSTKFTDALFSIKYYFDAHYKADDKQEGAGNFKSKSRRPDLKDMDMIEDDGRVIVYENPLALPLGLIAKKELADFSEDRLNPLDLQDKIANLISPGTEEVNYFILHDIDKPEIVNLEASKKDNGLTKYTRINPDPEQAYIKYKLPSFGSSSHYLTLSETLKESNSNILIDGKRLENARTSTVDTSQVINISAKKEDNKEHSLEIQLKKKTDSLLINNISLFSLNEESLKKLADYQQDRGLNIESFSSGNIKGTFITDPNHPYLLLSIPYSEGWHCKIDGQKVETFMALDALTGVAAGPGQHSIELYYRQPLLIEGILLSLSSILMLFSLVRKTKKKEANEASK